MHILNNIHSKKMHVKRAYLLHFTYFIKIKKFETVTWNISSNFCFIYCDIENIKKIYRVFHKMRLFPKYLFSNHAFHNVLILRIFWRMLQLWLFESDLKVVQEDCEVSRNIQWFSLYILHYLWMSRLHSRWCSWI